jgi:hypothetical protein
MVARGRRKMSGSFGGENLLLRVVGFTDLESLIQEPR